MGHSGWGAGGGNRMVALIGWLHSGASMNKLDLDSIEISGVDMKDYPDFCDAYISYA